MRPHSDTFHARKGKNEEFINNQKKQVVWIDLVVNLLKV